MGNLALVKMFVEEYKVDATQKTTNDRMPIDLAKDTSVIEYLKNLAPPFKEGTIKV